VGGTISKTEDRSVLAATLVRQAQQGSHDAFAKLYQQYCPQLFYFARKRLGSDDRASDCVQSVFLSALIHLNELRNPENFRGWLYRVCSQEIARIYRSEGRASDTLSLDAMDEKQQSDYDALWSQEDDTDSAIAASQELQVLHCCLAKLTKHQKDILVLRYYAELEPCEIVNVLEISSATVRKRLHDATVALRKAWEATAQRSAPEEASIRGLFKQDLQNAQTCGICPEGSIALGIAAALPDLLVASASPQVAGRAQVFLQTAHTGDVSKLLRSASTPAPGTTSSSIEVFLTTTKGKLAIVAATLLLAGFGYGGWLIVNRPPGAAVTEVAHRLENSVEPAAPDMPTVSAEAALTPAAKTSAGSASPTATQPAMQQAPANPVPAPTQTLTPDSTHPPSPAQLSSTSPAAPAPDPARPTLTVATSVVSYPLGIVLTPQRLIVDTGASAKAADGTTLPIWVAGLSALDTNQEGFWLVFLNARDAKSRSAPTRIIGVMMR